MRCMSRSAVSCCIQTPALLGDKLWILRRQLLVITSEKIWFCAASSILHDFERYWGKQRSTTNLVEPYFSKGNPNIKLVGYISCIISVHIPWKSWNIYSTVFHWWHPHYCWDFIPHNGGWILSTQASTTIISTVHWQNIRIFDGEQSLFLMKIIRNRHPNNDKK